MFQTWFQHSNACNLSHMITADISLVINECVLLLSLKVLFRIRQSFPLLLCLCLWGKHVCHSSGYSHGYCNVLIGWSCWVIGSYRQVITGSTVLALERKSGDAMVFIKMHVMRCKLLMISSVIIAIIIIFFSLSFFCTCMKVCKTCLQVMWWHKCLLNNSTILLVFHFSIFFIHCMFVSCK